MSFVLRRNLRSGQNTDIPHWDILFLKIMEKPLCKPHLCYSTAKVIATRNKHLVEIVSNTVVYKLPHRGIKSDFSKTGEKLPVIRKIGAQMHGFKGELPLFSL